MDVVDLTNEVEILELFEGLEVVDLTDCIELVVL
jgi:hypothetical protein